jgi:integrase
MAIINELPRIVGCPYVFSITGDGPFTSYSDSKRRLDGFMRKAAIEADIAYVAKDWRIHDLRRTAATALERLGVPLAVTEALLNHQSGSKAGVSGIYQRWSYGPEKREAVNKLGAHIMALVQAPALAVAA